MSDEETKPVHVIPQVASEDDKALAIIPQVTSLAKPQPKVLLAARFEVQRNEDLRRVFEEYKGTSDEESAAALAGVIADTLREKLQGSEADIQATARYLADEYQQVGDTLLLISSETGLPMARIREEDIWQPPEVPREDGSMVKPRPMVNPALLGFVMSWHFDTEREKQLAQELAPRVLQTPALAESGHPALMSITHDGRRKLVDQLREDIKGCLPSAVKGTPGEFLRCLDFSEPTADLPSFLGLKAFAHTKTMINDHKARNFRFDEMAVVKSSLAVQWTREIARTLCQIAHAEHPPTPIRFADYIAAGAGALWIAGGEELAALQHMVPWNRTFTVEGASTLVVLGEKIGHLVVRDYSVQHRVVHDRWEIAGSIEFDVWFDPKSDAIQPLVLTELPVRTYAAEVVV